MRVCVCVCLQGSGGQLGNVVGLQDQIVEVCACACMCVCKYFDAAMKDAATHCNMLQHTGTRQHTAPQCTILHRNVKHYNTLQHAARHCNTLQFTATHCNTLQHTATHCNTLHHTAPHCTTLQTHCCHPVAKCSHAVRVSVYIFACVHVSVVCVYLRLHVWVSGCACVRACA